MSGNGMMRRRAAEVLLAGGVGLMLSIGWAVAAQLPDSQASYSGEGVMTIADTEIPFRVYHDRGKERRELIMQGTTQVIIKRPDLGVATMLMPQMNMAMEMPIDMSAMSGLSDRAAAFNPEPIGTEMVAGEVATKHRLGGNDPSGGGFDGFVWLSEDRIVLRVDGNAGQGGQGTPLTIELTRLERGPQDAALFELPPGVQTMQMPGGMGGMEGMPAMPGMPEAEEAR